MRLGEQPEKLRHTIVKRFYKTTDLLDNILEHEFDYIEYGDIFNQVSKLLKLFGIKSDDLRVDTSYIINFINLNRDSLENEDYDNLIEPQLKTYEIPYWVVETQVVRIDYMEKIESYGDSSDAVNIFKELEYDGAIDLYSGKELDKENIDGSFDDWGEWMEVATGLGEDIDTFDTLVDYDEYDIPDLPEVDDHGTKQIARDMELRARLNCADDDEMLIPGYDEENDSPLRGLGDFLYE